LDVSLWNFTDFNLLLSNYGSLIIEDQKIILRHYEAFIIKMKNV